jgi:type II secretory ATPase GspE/PulE/Tfp pilus assembly ATPase PilB-like protein
VILITAQRLARRLCGGKQPHDNPADKKAPARVRPGERA